MTILKERTILIWSMIILMMSSCASGQWQTSLVREFSVDNAINNATTDFVNTSKWSKKDSVFEVSIREPNKYLLRVSIIKLVGPIYVSSQDTAGSFHHNFPTRFIEKDGLLFIWRDSTVCITQELLSILSRYNRLDYSLSYMDEIIGGVNDDGAVGSVYYFCKKDLTNYKKTGISSFRKKYKTPTIKCK